MCCACLAAVPRRGSAACGERQCHTLNSNQNSAHNSLLLWGPILYSLYQLAYSNSLSPSFYPTPMPLSLMHLTRSCCGPSGSHFGGAMPVAGTLAHRQQLLKLVNEAILSLSSPIHENQGGTLTLSIYAMEFF